MRFSLIVWNFRPFITRLRRVFLNKMCFWVFRAEQIFFPPVYGLFYRQKIRSMICYPKKRDVVAWRMVWSFTQKKTACNFIANWWRTTPGRKNFFVPFWHLNSPGWKSSGCSETKILEAKYCCVYSLRTVTDAEFHGESEFAICLPQKQKLVEICWKTVTFGLILPVK